MSDAKMITALWCRSHGACHEDDRLNDLFDRPMTLAEVLTRNDGFWATVKPQDRLWVASYALNDADKMAFARDLLEIATALVADDAEVVAACCGGTLDEVNRLRHIRPAEPRLTQSVLSLARICHHASSHEALQGAMFYAACALSDGEPAQSAAEVNAWRNAKVFILNKLIERVQPCPS